MAKVKSLCKWKEKDIAKRIDLLTAITEEPKFACKKCARVANTKKALCKAVPLATRLPKIERLRVVA
ncbi:hypothetical protein JIN77_16085 [Verrucomicrobiaceae bacterium R5-34]|uniref:Uncharacterized protein n=1 Tax=Oceaniferula flava TaxID=2800421 RepID=A0AAE2SAM1_9BACT|nr:hypothetical protein [Oceaniferula flavus]MBK1832258.1 hypothetical protein [Verrucomicrobiaceae bacterium R5-34]MBK1854898.1 hypothetical protein [Oceaniferula flavus]MBM1136204.1 hypothetical protein [Oceaniferula flavus]